MKKYILVFLLLMGSCTVGQQKGDVPPVPSSDNFIENITDLGTLYQYDGGSGSAITINQDGSIDYDESLIGGPRGDTKMTFVEQITPTKAIYKRFVCIYSPSSKGTYYLYTGISIVNGEIWINKATNNSFLHQIGGINQNLLDKKAEMYAKVYAKEHIDWTKMSDLRLFYKQDRSLDQSSTAIQKFIDTYKKTYELECVDASYTTNIIQAILAEDRTLVLEKGGSVYKTYDIIGIRSLNTSSGRNEAYFRARGPAGSTSYVSQIIIGIYDDYMYSFVVSAHFPDSTTYNLNFRSLRKDAGNILF